MASCGSSFSLHKFFGWAKMATSNEQNGRPTQCHCRACNQQQAKWNYSPEYMQQCEINYLVKIIKENGREEFNSIMAEIEKHRGKKTAMILTGEVNKELIGGSLF